MTLGAKKHFTRKKGDTSVKEVAHTRLKVPARATVYYAISLGISKGISVICTPIFTRLMTEYEFGSYSLYVSWLCILSVLATLELGGNVINKALIDSPNEKSAVTISATALTLGSALSFFVITLLLCPTFTVVTGLERPILILMCGQMLFDGVTGVILSCERFSYKYKMVCACNLFVSVFSPVLGIALIGFTSSADKGRIAGTLLASGAVAAALAIKAAVSAIRDGVGVHSMLRHCKRLIKPAVHLLPYYLCRTLGANADKLLITKHFGKEYVAKYAVAASLGLAPSFLISALGFAAVPWIMRRLAKGEAHRVKETVSGLCALLFSAVAVLALLAPELMSALAPSGYGEAIGAVYPLGLSLIPFFLLLAVNGAVAYEGRTALTSVTAVIGAAVGFFAQVLLIRAFGYTTVSFGALVSQSVTLSLAMALSPLARKTVPILRTVGLGTLCCVLSLAAYLLKDQLPLRILLLSIPFITAARAIPTAKALITE